MFKIRELIQQKYAKETIEIQKKAYMLFIITLFGAPFSVISATLMFIQGNYPIFIMLVFNALAYIFTYIALRYKSYVFATNLFLFSLYLLLHSVVFLFPYDITYLVCQYSALFALSCIMYSMIGTRKYQILIHFIASIFIMGFLCLSKISIWNDDYFIPILIAANIILMSGIIVLFINTTTKQIISIAENEASINRKRFLSLQDLITESEKGKSIGDRVVDITKQTIDTIKDLQEKFNRFREQSHHLDSELQSAAAAIGEVVTQTTTGEQEIENQNTMILESTDYIRDMMKSVGRISKTTRTKTGKIRKLADVTKSMEKKITQANQSFAAVRDSTSKIIAINSVIMDIAEQTHVLAVNAAIEAARAGTAGTGFAIVSREMQKLSSHTNSNSKNIKTGVMEILTGIDTSFQAYQGAVDYFREIREEIIQFLEILQEIMERMTVMSTGSEQVIQKISGLNESTSRTSSAIKKIKTTMKEDSAVMTGVKDFSSEATKMLDTTISEFTSILENTADLNAMGMENMKQINYLREQLEKIKQEV